MSRILAVIDAGVEPAARPNRLVPAVSYLEDNPVYIFGIFGDVAADQAPRSLGLLP